jgi:hypothetical protein
MRWAYDAGTPYKNKKHGWKQPYAGVEEERFGKKTLRVGRCPANLDQNTAAQILNQGLAYLDEQDLEEIVVTPVAQCDRYPTRIFAVHEGVPYEARKTEENKSFHGCPVLPEKFDELPESIQTYLKEQAVQQGSDLGPWLEEWRVEK